MPLTEYVPTWAKLDAISDALIQSNQYADMRILLFERTSWPHWYLQLLSQIYTVSSGEPLEYISSSVKDSRVEGDDVYAFTGDLVIHTRVSNFSDELGYQDAKVRTTAWSRDELAELTVASLNAYPTRDSGGGVRFPQNLRLDLRYADRPSFSLPLPPYNSSTALETIYPSLLGDLSWRGARPSETSAGR